MSSQLQPEPTSAAVSRDSTAPLLATSETTTEKEEKSRMRDFFKFGKKGGDDDKKKSKSATGAKVPAPLPGVGGLQPVSPLASPLTAASPPRAHPYGSPASPGRHALRSASPRTHSPASSMIFERNVQDEAPAQASPQIPSHITIENHIPPALESASEAITNSKLDPDTVEIVTHATHQPAAANLTGAMPEPSIASSIHEELAASFSRHDTDNVSNYASLDTGDLRRLSFISFADVVHAEQELADPRRDSSHMTSLTSHPALAAPRSPSPMRSPVSLHHAGTSSPSAGISSANKGQESLSQQNVRGTGSPLLGPTSPAPGSELNIETMSQALRKTHSGDLSGFRTPMSPVSIANEDVGYEKVVK